MPSIYDPSAAIRSRLWASSRATKKYILFAKVYEHEKIVARIMTDRDSDHGRRRVWMLRTCSRTSIKKAPQSPRQLRDAWIHKREGGCMERCRMGNNKSSRRANLQRHVRTLEVTVSLNHHWCIRERALEYLERVFGQ
jgi:hypothetical protein